MAITNPNPFGQKAKKLSPKPTPRLFNPNPFGSAGAVAPPPKITATPAKAPASRPLTAQQIAQQTVQQSLAPILASLGVQRKDLRSEQQSQQQALRDFTDQVMRYIAGIPASAAGSYDEAASATTNLAQQAATGLANLNPSAETSALLGSIGAPQQQVDAIQQQNQNVFGGGGATLFKTAGAIPADVIANDKAQQLAFYKGLPAVAGLTGTQAMKQLLFTQAKDSRSLAEKLAEVQAKRPSLVQGALSDMQTAQLKAQQQDSLDQYRIAQLEQKQANAKTEAEWKKAQLEIDRRNADIKARALQLDSAYKGSKLSIDQQNADTRAAAVQASAAATNARLNTQAQQWAARYKLDLSKLDLQERKFKASKVSGGKRGLTAKQVLDLSKNASAYAKEARLGWTDKDGNFHDPVPYQQVLADMIGDGIPLSVAQQALARYWRPNAPGIQFQKTGGAEGGFYYFPEDVVEGVGIQGRPKVPFQLRKKK